MSGMTKFFKKIFKISKEKIPSEKEYDGADYFIANKEVAINYIQAIKNFDREYELSLKKKKFSREFILDLYRYDEKNGKFLEEKRLYMEIVQGFVIINIEDETDVMNYSYLELNGSDEIKSFPDISIIWSFSIKGMPLKHFAKSKEEVHKVIEAFYIDDLSEIRNNFITEVKKDLRKLKEIPNYIMNDLKKLKQKKIICKEDFEKKLENLDEMLDTEIIRDVLFEKIENYIKENEIEEMRFDTGEIYDYDNMVKFIKENLVQPY